MTNLSDKSSTTDTEPDDFYYMALNDNSSDFKIKRENLFTQDLSTTSDVTFSDLTLSSGLTANNYSTTSSLSLTPNIGGQDFTVNTNTIEINNGDHIFFAMHAECVATITMTLPSIGTISGFPVTFSSLDELNGNLVLAYSASGSTPIYLPLGARIYPNIGTSEALVEATSYTYNRLSDNYSMIFFTGTLKL